MYTYNISQWMAFLVLYSFLGWVWECCYVSVRQKKWVNRGFLNGPLLPIYGFGAVIVLFAALPFKGNVIAVYFAGMISATILEYCTGAAMEAIFKVRYWDYSNNRFNLHGHICLFCSIGWGFFSVALIYCLHNPFEHLVLSIPDTILTPVLYVTMMLISADFALSYRTAIELRDLLIQMEKVRKEMQLLQKRVEVYEAFFADDLNQKLEALEETREEFKEFLHDKKAELNDKKTELKAKEEEELKSFLDSMRRKKETFENFEEEAKEHLRIQLQDEKEEAQMHLHNLRTRMDEGMKAKPAFTKLLKRNPSASSAKYKTALSEIKKEIHAELERRHIEQKK